MVIRVWVITFKMLLEVLLLLLLLLCQCFYKIKFIPCTSFLCYFCITLSNSSGLVMLATCCKNFTFCPNTRHSENILWQYKLLCWLTVANHIDNKGIIAPWCPWLKLNMYAAFVNNQLVWNPVVQIVMELFIRTSLWMSL